MLGIEATEVNMTRSWTAGLIAMAFFTGLALGFAGPAPAKEMAPPKCSATYPCTCDGLDACTKSCAGAGCKFEAHGGGARTFHCPKGKCSVTSDATGASALDCKGGGCSMTCSGAGACAITECTKDCHLECTGTGKCTSSCTDCK